MTHGPRLEHREVDGVALVTDPDAPAAGYGVAFTGRHGGVSEGPYESLNLAARVGDDPAAVDENRARAAHAAGFEVDRLVLARQVHGAGVIEADGSMSGVVGVADVLVTRSPAIVIGILTADCAPVVVAGRDAIAVAHAGWRGVVAGVVESALGAIGEPRCAWIGPAIHDCCYKVGDDVVRAFAERSLDAGVDRVDPAGAAAQVLRRSGVKVAVCSDCTFHSPGYFSFRRRRVTGRQGAFAWLRV